MHHPHPSVVRRQRLSRRQRFARRVLPFVASLLLATPLAGALRLSPARPAVASVSLLDGHLRRTYERLGAASQGLRYEVFSRAMTGYLNLRQAGRLADQPRLAVVDFDLPSTDKRLWVLDLAEDKILFHTLVAHGHNSGENTATQFSNTNESNMSSLGFYVTGQPYEGKHGRSLRLLGQDEGFNTNAEARAVVMHGADYVSEKFIRQNGRLGRSLGCPALPLDQYAPIIEAVRGGSCLFIYKSDAGYASRLLDERRATAALAGGPGAAS